jgi:hypothetical protein
MRRSTRLRRSDQKILRETREFELQRGRTTDGVVSGQLYGAKLRMKVRNLIIGAIRFLQPHAQADLRPL